MICQGLFFAAKEAIAIFVLVDGHAKQKSDSPSRSSRPVLRLGHHRHCLPEHIQRLHLVRVPTFFGAAAGRRFDLSVQLIGLAFKSQRMDHAKASKRVAQNSEIE